MCSSRLKSLCKSHWWKFIYTCNWTLEKFLCLTSWHVFFFPRRKILLYRPCLLILFTWTSQQKCSPTTANTVGLEVIMRRSYYTCGSKLGESHTAVHEQCVNRMMLTWAKAVCWVTEQSCDELEAAVLSKPVREWFNRAHWRSRSEPEYLPNCTPCVWLCSSCCERRDFITQKWQKKDCYLVCFFGGLFWMLHLLQAQVVKSTEDCNCVSTKPDKFFFSVARSP